MTSFKMRRSIVRPHNFDAPACYTDLKIFNLQTEVTCILEAHENEQAKQRRTAGWQNHKRCWAFEAR